MGYPTYDLTFKKLREQNKERCSRWHPGGIDDWTLSEWAVAAAGEMGEACNVVKKLNRDAGGMVGNQEITRAHLQEMLAHEIADIVIYLDLLAQRADIDLEEAIIEKFNLVSARNRFPERL